MWLAGVVYFTFSTTVIVWIYQHNNELNLCQRYILYVFATSVYTLTVIFEICQTVMKYQSTIKTYNFDALLATLDETGYLTYATLGKANTCNPGEIHFFRDGWSGVLILLATTVFFIAQVTLLLFFVPAGSI